MSETELHDMMRDPRYWRDRDPEFVGRVTAGFRALFPPEDLEPDPATELAQLRAEVEALRASRARLTRFARAEARQYGSVAGFEEYRAARAELTAFDLGEARPAPDPRLARLRVAVRRLLEPCADEGAPEWNELVAECGLERGDLG